MLPLHKRIASRYLNQKFAVSSEWKLIFKRFDQVLEQSEKVVENINRDYRQLKRLQRRGNQVEFNQLLLQNEKLLEESLKNVSEIFLRLERYQNSIENENTYKKLLRLYEDAGYLKNELLKYQKMYSKMFR